MGCDIHIQLEYRPRGNEDDDGPRPWRNIMPHVQNEYYDPAASAEENGGEEHWAKCPVGRDRNYDLFSQIAGVRDYGDNDRPEPRGIPGDISGITKRDYDSWGCDAHSASHFTFAELQELIDSDSGGIRRSGIISPEQIRALEEDGVMPSSWCQGCSMDDWERREWLEPLPEGGKTPAEYWLDELKEAALLSLSHYDLVDSWDYDKARAEQDYAWGRVRVVFWFDN